MGENQDQPGVSGKSKDGKKWIDPQKYEEQKEFMDGVGKGGNLFGRSDLSDQDKDVSHSISEEQVREALKRSPEADIQNVEIRLEGSAVHLYGQVEDNRSIRAMESIALNVPGVSKVISHVQLRNDERHHST